ncbi:peptidase MA family metallohydrolase [candidate division KSB1 bacterium]
MFRVVFNINIGDNGLLTGTVDSPDKGVNGIPLSNVKVTNDSVLFEVSAFLICYKGRFSKDKNSIIGIWKEGGTSFSIILIRTNEKIEPKKPQAPKFLDTHKSSQHFDLYSSKSDKSVLDNIAKTLEKNYSRITENLQTKFTEKIQVYIYPDIKVLHNAIFLPDALDWTVGSASRNELKIVSPLNPGNVHTYESIMQAIVHELVHTAVLNVRKERGLAGLPKWLNEGYAFYEAGQMTDNMRKSVKLNAQKEVPLSWIQLDTASTVEFGNMDGYALSTTIIEFLVNTYGFNNLIKLIKAPENIEDIYGTSKGDLEKQWLQYLRNE